MVSASFSRSQNCAILTIVTLKDEYLGITIDYSIPHKVVLTMFDYLEDVIVEASQDLKNSRSYYPRNDFLMKVDEDSIRLPTKDADLFHRHVARLFFTSKRARPDIQVCVAYLCTRMKAPYVRPSNRHYGIEQLFVHHSSSC